MLPLSRFHGGEQRSPCRLRHVLLFVVVFIYQLPSAHLIPASAHRFAGAMLAVAALSAPRLLPAVSG